jgi:hypothetical protein
MTGRYVRVFLTCLLLLAVASPSLAARRSSLAGNLLIQDADDVFFFPHLVTQHKRTVSFDFGPFQSGTSPDILGSGGMIFGNESVTLGAFTHRSEFLGALTDAFFTRGDIDHKSGGADGNFGTGPWRTGLDQRHVIGVGPTPLNWIDVLAGTQMGEMPIGIRFSLGRDNIERPRTNVPPDNESSDATAVNVVLGTRLQDMGIDASVDVAFASAQEKVPTGTGTQNDVTESSPFSIALGARRVPTEESDALTLGVLGMFGFTTSSEDYKPATGTGSSTDYSSLNVALGAGPVYRPNDRTNVAMYGTFEYQRWSEEWKSGTPAVTNTDTYTDLTIPGWNIAAEVEMASWLQFRAGMRSRYIFADFHEERGTTPAVDDHEKDNELQFGWTTGIGIKFDNFRIDGVLDPYVVNTGTDLLGSSSDLFGLVTTSFTF